MAKSFIPKANHKDLDLTEYGGEGTLRISGMTAGISFQITERLQALAQKDGYSLNDLDKKADEINARYNLPMILNTIDLCVEIEDDEGFRKLTFDEINGMPPRLAMDVYTIILELNNFPLVQNAGEASKQEQSKPTDAE